MSKLDRNEIAPGGVVVLYTLLQGVSYAKVLDRTRNTRRGFHVTGAVSRRRRKIMLRPARSGTEDPVAA
jgi:hypothetical protein